MFKTIAVLIAALLTGSSATGGERLVNWRPYTTAEAYRVYDAVLPGEQSYPKVAKGTLVIIEEARSIPGQVSPGCVTKEAALDFKDALANFTQVNQKNWLLQRRFSVHEPYVLVSRGTSVGPYWSADFEKRYPGGAGYIELSPVGFNADRTRAVVFVSSTCGGFCGSERLHLLERIGAQWKEVNGITCRGAS